MCALDGVGMGLGWDDVNVHMKFASDLMLRFGWGWGGVMLTFM